MKSGNNRKLAPTAFHVLTALAVGCMHAVGIEVCIPTMTESICHFARNSGGAA
ncbi:hypothetical protein [Lysobacter gummosus]|uniref:hypothetical protein n=1 Tax=Lysobacter gummosus TaxID=262324 RepID=UPI00363EE4C2